MFNTSTPSELGEVFGSVTAKTPLRTGTVQLGLAIKHAQAPVPGETSEQRQQRIELNEACGPLMLPIATI